MAGRLSLILLFIGVKLVLHFLHKQDDAIPEVSIGLSPAVILTILGVSTVASLVARQGIVMKGTE